MSDNALSHAPDLARFAAVKAWVFDLDNTLYPRHTNLFAQVDVRIRDYVQRLLALPADEAQLLQRDYYRRYGTTLRGLMLEHRIAPDDFLEYVHDIDHSAVPPIRSSRRRSRGCPASATSSPTDRAAMRRR